LTLAGLIKHVTVTERQWSRFVIEGPSAMGAPDEEQAMSNWLNGFRMLEGETDKSLLVGYEAWRVRPTSWCRRFPTWTPASHYRRHPGSNRARARWSARRVFLHIIAETSQHTGHADIIRESLDGAKSMG